MYTDKMTMSELPEAAAVFAASGYDADAMRPLMDLLQKQTDYYQKRFWTLIDAMKANSRAAEIVNTLNTK